MVVVVVVVVVVYVVKYMDMICAVKRANNGSCKGLKKNNLPPPSPSPPQATLFRTIPARQTRCYALVLYR